MPSVNKEKFMSGTNQESYELRASDLDKIIPHYQEKHGITIIKNGHTEHSKPIIDKKKKEIDEQIAMFLNPDTKFSAYFIYNYCDDTCKFPSEVQFPSGLQSKFNKYLVENNFTLKLGGKVKSDVDAKILNAAIRHFFENEKIDPDKFIDKTIDLSVTYLKNKKEDVSVSKSEAMSEIAAIKKTLKPGDAVGYVFTNGHNIDANHFETVIITSSRVIRPIVWANDNDAQKKGTSLFDLPDAAHTKLTDDIVLGRAQPILPQGGFVECGTLGLLYLKELLKDKARLLNNSLEITYYDKNNKETTLFIPSPEVLRYSQSSLFNRTMAIFMAPSEQSVREIMIKKEILKIVPLKALLKKSIEKAKENGNYLLAEKNENILKNLDTFQAKWMEGYRAIHEKRDPMSTMDEKNNEINRLLAYESNRMKKISDEAKQTDTAPAVEKPSFNKK